MTTPIDQINEIHRLSENYSIEDSGPTEFLFQRRDHPTKSESIFEYDGKPFFKFHSTDKQKCAVAALEHIVTVATQVKHIKIEVPVSNSANPTHDDLRFIVSEANNICIENRSGGTLLIAQGGVYRALEKNLPKNLKAVVISSAAVDPKSVTTVNLGYGGLRMLTPETSVVHHLHRNEPPKEYCVEMALQVPDGTTRLLMLVDW